MQSEHSCQSASGQINGIPVQGNIRMLGTPGKASVVYGDICTSSAEDSAKLRSLEHLIYQGFCWDGEGQQSKVELPIQWASVQEEMLSFCGLVEAEDSWILNHLKSRH
ncbi:hypothetical protein [Deinococcus cellulosilyticus]|uniref:Uncharacterized protein n=1 Tax=Deinococcus cellulosilyticus (strain DSM 18568 / NBRC 106333 / KACC 11606 / 5516J-15) TaxID=1223518 RepID=A0A511N4Z2_DEIC1|nr:hypothetical protein [Deinococcus cellulosilyticus]GEM47491.1 hypothetical protein DC3_31260 [Deinococcus cellulosilyticus NBRC 106333 = KACC 11606]